MEIKGYLKDNISSINLEELGFDYKQLDFQSLHLLYRLHQSEVIPFLEVANYIEENYKRELRQETMKVQHSLEDSLLYLFGKDLFVTKLCTVIFNEIYVDFDFEDAVSMEYNSQVKILFKIAISEDIPSEPIELVIWYACRSDTLIMQNVRQIDYVIKSVNYFKSIKPELKDFISVSNFLDNYVLSINQDCDKAGNSEAENSDADLTICLEYIKSKMPASYFKQEGLSESDIILAFVRGQLSK